MCLDSFRVLSTNGVAIIATRTDKHHRVRSSHIGQISQQGSQRGQGPACLTDLRAWFSSYRSNFRSWIPSWGPTG